jgi:hypothetical protein
LISTNIVAWVGPTRRDTRFLADIPSSPAKLENLLRKTDAGASPYQKKNLNKEPSWVTSDEAWHLGENCNSGPLEITAENLAVRFISHLVSLILFKALLLTQFFHVPRPKAKHFPLSLPTNKRETFAT